MVKHYKKIIGDYFKEHSFIEDNIDSFNNFLEKEMQKVVDEVNEIVPTIIPQEYENFKIKLGKIRIEKPEIVDADGSKRPVFPMEARLRNLTYSAPIYLEISAYINDIQRDSFVAQIGKIPVMLKSKFCHLHGLKKEDLIKHGEDPDDFGGYFILNGNERVLVIVEDLASNKIFVSEAPSGPSKFIGKIYSEKDNYRIPHTLEQMKEGIFYLSFARFKRIPVIAIIKALGLTKDQEIMQAISPDKIYDDVLINLYHFVDLKTKEDALEFIAKKIGITQKELREEKTLEQLDRYLLPHLKLPPKERIIKAYNLCKFVKKFIMVSQEGIKLPSKDHYMNKRLKLSGDLLADLFRVNVRSLVQDILYNFQRLVKRGKFTSIRTVIREQLLTSRIKSAMATGTWPGGRAGISQNMARTNSIDTISNLQRVVSLLTSSQENFEARALHSTHWGRLCLSKDSNILLADKYSQRTLENLQNCWNHHGVSTFDINSNKITPSKIASYFTSNPRLMGKKTYKFISESGREIVSTEDHPFYTMKGWIDAKNLKVGDKVAVYPSLDSVEKPKLPTEDIGEIIVSEENIKINSPKRFKHYIKELRKNELIPLTVNNYKIEIIARLLGHLFSDGHLSKRRGNSEFYLGIKEDAERVAEDIRMLGFEPSKIIEKNSRIKIGNKYVYHKTFVLTKGGALSHLLNLAGAPAGKKTDMDVNIPSWILKSSLSVKREFLASLLGGDGPKPRVSIRKDRRSGSKVKIDNIIFHKRADKKNSIINFSNSIKKLFREFGVSIYKINTSYDYTRKDGTKMLKCEIIFSKSMNNIKKLLTKIGYRYCIQKESEAKYIGEWLRIRNIELNKRIKLKKEVKKLYKNGLKPKEISKLLNINYRVVNGWLFESKKYEKTRLSQNMLVPCHEWIKTEKIGNSGAIWQKITNKEMKEIDDVRDFTTIENTHSFIANGFITHNCPVETPEGTPIGLRKNLAMMSSITKSELPEEKIRKSLESIGLETIK